jgi:YVTN family beta-propeller protein
MYDGQIDVHGLGFSRDGRYLDVIDVTTNAAHVIDTASNKVLRTIYLGRAPHEGFFSPDGRHLWVAERGQDTVAVIDWRSNRVVDRIVSEDGPSKVVFSPDAGWLTSTTYGPRCSTSSTRRAAGSSTG